MTLVTLPGVQDWPGYADHHGAAPGFSSEGTLDAAGEYQAHIFCAREDMTVSHVGFRTGTCTGSPTAEVRIETVATDGTPSGTLIGTNTNVTTATLVSNTNALHALTASASITKGTVFAVKILYNSGTSFVVQRITGYLSNRWNLPYVVTNTSGSAVKSDGVSGRILALGSSSTVFYQLTNAFYPSTITNSTFNNTNGARRGMRFKVKFPCRCVGLRYYANTASGDFNAILFDDAGSELGSSSTAFDGNHSVNGASGILNCYFDNAVTLSTATWYRAVIEPSSATNCSVSFFTMPSADYLTGLLGGSDCHYTTFASAAWDDTNTGAVAIMDILYDQLDDGAGSGGASKGKLTGLLG